jgi:hypothetical protein
MKFFIFLSCILFILKYFEIESLKVIKFSDQLQSSSENNEESKNTKFSMNVFVVHQGNKLLNSGKPLKFKISYENDYLVLKSKGEEKQSKTVRKIPLAELLYFNEDVIFQTSSLENIDSKIYKNLLYNNFILGIRELEKLDGRVLSHGLCIFHHKPTHPSKILAIIFSPYDEQPSDHIMENFKKEFSGKYHAEIIAKKMQWNIPDIMEDTDFHFLYWNSIQNFKETVPNYVGLADEGVVQNREPNRLLHNVKFAFRFDQIIECQGNNNATGIVTPDAVRKSLPIDSCCVGYNLNWNGKIGKEVFCSMSKVSKSCEIEINLFKKFVFRKCMRESIQELAQLVERNKNFNNSKYSLLTKLHFKFVFIALKKYNLFTQIDMNSKYGKLLKIAEPQLPTLTEQIEKYLQGIDTYAVLGNTKPQVPEQKSENDEENENDLEKKPDVDKKQKSNYVTGNSTNISTNKTTNDSIANDKITNSPQIPITKEDKIRVEIENQKAQEAQNTADLSKTVIHEMEVNLGRELNHKEISEMITIIDKMGDKFKKMIENHVTITSDILVTYEQLGVSGVAELTKKSEKNRKFNVKINQKNLTDCLKENKTRTGSNSDKENPLVDPTPSTLLPSSPTPSSSQVPPTSSQVPPSSSQIPPSSSQVPPSSSQVPPSSSQNPQEEFLNPDPSQLLSDDDSFEKLSKNCQTIENNITVIPRNKTVSKI